MNARIIFEDLKFRSEPSKDKKENEGEFGEFVTAEFMNHYYFLIPKTQLSEIGEFEIDEDGAILFGCSEKRARQKLDSIIDKGLKSGLFNRIRNKKTIYVYEGSGIPLIGADDFGLIDRGTNIIEVKPSTGCNLSCAFCSVFEGENDFRDILVEEEYIVQEFRKLAAIKKHKIEACINPHGEPLLYPKIVQLVSDLKNTENVETISVNTNGCMLSKKLIDELADAGLSRINLSIHSLNPQIASKLAQMPYNVNHVLKMIKYCEGKIDVLLAPVFIPGQNESDIDDIIELSKKIRNRKFPAIGIQNFLNYKGGRNIAEQMPWENFFAMLKQKESEHKTRLIIEENLFNIQYDETLPKPFKRGQIIKAEIKSPGRAKNEFIAAANGRTVIIMNPKKQAGIISVKLIRDKHNIYRAVSA